jgi:hypothetical protein
MMYWIALCGLICSIGFYFSFDKPPMPLCQTTNTLGDIPVASKHQGLFVLFSHPCSDDVLSRRNALSSCTWSFSTFFLHGLV